MSIVPRVWGMGQHALCIIALMWTGLVNGQPFFFPDTTNYIRAADIAVYLASDRTISTVWTERYSEKLDQTRQIGSKSPASGASKATANDIGSGLIMGGRSPYIGALMYLGWVSGWFWPFILLQATIAYLLIVLALRRFDLAQPRNVLLVTLGLALTTSLPTYNSLLLADAFTSFGILSFLLIAMPGKLSRTEFFFLAAVLIVSVTTHLTHIMILMGMLSAAAMLALLGWLKLSRRAWVTGITAIAAGLISVQATALATQAVFGQPPQLLPLLTARFYTDGPGKSFIESGCEGQRFEVCRLKIGSQINTAWLFSTDPRFGTYMLAAPDQRRRMGEEDVSFALSVLRYDPVGQIGKMLLNTYQQIVWIDYAGLNQGCFKEPSCWESLPTGIRNTLRDSPSGRNEWPEGILNSILYTVVIGSLAALVFILPKLFRMNAGSAVELRNWLLILAAAILVNSFLGGAVTDPQYRYQGRLIWLVVLIAAIALLKYRAIGNLPGFSGKKSKSQEPVLAVV